MRRAGLRALAPLAAPALAALLGGCATYHHLPLPAAADLAPAGATGAAAVPARLALAQAGALAVARDPALAAARAQVTVARAQAYNAGLLPDPTLGLGLQHPFNGGSPSDHHNAWNATLGESLVALVMHADVHEAASAHYLETLLAWRWQAEQVALAAEVSYLEVWRARREVSALRREAAAADALAGAAVRAHAAGALATALYNQALGQAVAVHVRLNAAADREVQAETRLATLLRVQAGRAWRLSPPPRLAAPSASRLTAAITALPRHRLDLLALEAGYRSADAKLRADILGQFPILDIGFTRARDNTGVNSIGFGITLRLPIFNGNRGQIAIDRATRRALNAAYQAHLDTAANHVRAAAKQLALARAELAATAKRLPGLARAAKSAEHALGAGDLTRYEAFTTLAAWLDARISADQLRASVAELALTLQTLLALPSSSNSRIPAGRTTT